MDLVKDEHGVVCRNLCELVGDAGRCLVVNEDEIVSANLSADEALSVLAAEALVGLILRGDAGERSGIAKAEAPFGAPGIEGILGADHHEAADFALGGEKCEGAECRCRLAGTRDREVARARHGGEEERVAYLAVLEGAYHRAIHHVRKRGKALVILRIASLDFVTRTVVLLGEFAHRIETGVELRVYLEHGVQCLSNVGQASCDALVVAIVTGHLERERPVCAVAGDVATAADFKLGVTAKGGCIKRGRIEQQLLAI